MMKDLLDLLQSLCIIVYCFLGSAAFLRSLLRGEHSSSRPTPAKQVQVRRRPNPNLNLKEEDEEERIPKSPAAEQPPTPAPQVPHSVLEQPAAPEPDQYPCTPPPGWSGQPYEIANPGYKLTDGYNLQLHPSPDGVLMAYRIGDEICVYVQPDLEDDSTNIQLLGLRYLYDMYDQYEKPYRVLPKGCLRITNYQPAVCTEYGSNLTMLRKGCLVVIPVEETIYMNQGF